MQNNVSLLSVRLLVNGRDLAVKFLRCQKLHVDFSTAQGVGASNLGILQRLVVALKIRHIKYQV